MNPPDDAAGWRLGHYLTGEQCNRDYDTQYRCSQSQSFFHDSFLSEIGCY